MKSYDVSRLPSMIELGFDGENNWRPNSFDCSSLLKNHPNGVITLWLLPQGESQAFPVAVECDGNTIVWTPLSEEMTAKYNTLQIHYKSCVFKIFAEAFEDRRALFTLNEIL